MIILFFNFLYRHTEIKYFIELINNINKKNFQIQSSVELNKENGIEKNGFKPYNSGDRFFFWVNYLRGN